MAINTKDLSRNSEGYPDPTAYAALKSIIGDERAKKKASYVVSVIRFIVRESGFELLNRVELRDRRTGQIFK